VRGAEILAEVIWSSAAVVAGDLLEMWVERPPTTREAAIALAQQQYIFCDETDPACVGGLAAMLLNGTTWFFWWD
jgi:hypothetical protein